MLTTLSIDYVINSDNQYECELISIYAVIYILDFLTFRVQIVKKNL